MTKPSLLLLTQTLSMYVVFNFRLIFFEELDDQPGMLSLQKSHRGAIRSVTAVLHLDQCDSDDEDELPDEDVLLDHVFDLQELL